MFEDNKGYYEIQLDNKWLIIIFIVFVVILGIVFVWGMKVGKDTAELEIGLLDKGGNSSGNRNVFAEQDLTGEKGTDQWNNTGKKDNRESYDLKTGLIEDRNGKPDSGENKTGESVEKQSEKTKTDAASLKQTEKNKIETGGSQSEPTAGSYQIQILSIKDKDKAEYYAKVLKEEGYPAYLATVELGTQGFFYRVRVGSYKTKEEAQTQISKILKEEKLQPILKGKKNLLIIKQF
jgi:septal ring-binding cell division protein DamX